MPRIRFVTGRKKIAGRSGGERGLIERFFRDLTANQIWRGVFQYLEQLITAIGNYIDHQNRNPKLFIWTAKGSDILQKVTRARAALHT